MKIFSENITIVEIIAFALVVLQVLYYIVQLFYLIVSPITANKFRKYMSWKQYNKLIDKLAKSIIKSGNNYKMIVAFGRGGAICAASLSCRLGSIPVLALDREYLTGKNSKIVSFYEDKIILNNKYCEMKKEPILILSQQSDPGITLSALEKVMQNSGFERIDKCAVLKSEKTSDVDLRYCAYMYSADKKCKKFPWENQKQYKDIMK